MWYMFKCRTLGTRVVFVKNGSVIQCGFFVRRIEFKRVRVVVNLFAGEIFVLWNSRE